MGLDFDHLLDYQKRRHMLARQSQNGVTLIELLIGIVIVSMMLALGMPSFSSMIQNAQVRGAAESVMNGLQSARNEALRRNVNVRFTLTDTTGRIAWTVECVVATTDCPAGPILSASSSDSGANARVGISTTSPIPAYTTALASGAGLSSGAGVTFNSLGSIPAANIGTDITRIDVTNSAMSDARRLVIVLGIGGLIRMCDPLLALSANPQGCA
jgi:type IV fimbrial biogenesis protein FimT